MVLINRKNTLLSTEIIGVLSLGKTMEKSVKN
jgi:hypothetical protein